MKAYTPTWDTPVGIQFNGQPSGVSVNPKLCLTPESAVELAALFPQYISAITFEFPSSLGGAFSFEASSNAHGGKVPWFNYVNGTKDNAANVAGIFDHGFPIVNALPWALMQIQGVMDAGE